MLNMWVVWIVGLDLNIKVFECSMRMKSVGDESSRK